MTKCGECRHFKTPFRRGRIAVTCSDLGEVVDGQACPEFQAIKPDTPHFDFNYESVFMNIMTDIFEIHKAADITVETIRIQLAQQGNTIDFDPKFFVNAVQKVSQLMTMHKLLLGVGLGMYEDEIMSHLIADRFARRDLPMTRSQPHSPAQAIDTLPEPNSPVGLGEALKVKTDVEQAAKNALDKLGQALSSKRK